VDRQTNSAKGAFGRQEGQDSAEVRAVRAAPRASRVSAGRRRSSILRLLKPIHGLYSAAPGALQSPCSNGSLALSGTQAGDFQQEQERNCAAQACVVKWVRPVLSGDKRPAAVQLTRSGLSGDKGIGLASTSILEIIDRAVVGSSAAQLLNLVNVNATSAYRRCG
jgi:hypothetical protein